jgi:peptidoglycan L-alanyl-D-glutamate endopeptidase CwlK
MAYVLGSRSLSRLEGVHPDLVRVVKRAIELTEQDFTVQEGLRTLVTQKEYVRRGVSKTLNSKHLKQPDGFGHAVDLVPWINGQPRWEWPPIYKIARAVDDAAQALGVRLTWGGVWDRRMDQYGGSAAAIEAEVQAYCRRHPGPDFIDGPHYQLA